jgi:hypothetical protein
MQVTTCVVLCFLITAWAAVKVIGIIYHETDNNRK